MRTHWALVALPLLLSSMAAQAQAVLVARSVGPNQWKLETGPATPALRNIRLAEGQKIILIDGKGTREIKGPGDLMLLSRGSAKGVATFGMIFRTGAAKPGPSVKAGVRGGPGGEAKADWQELTPRDEAPPQ